MFRNVQCSRIRLLSSPWNAASLADGSRRLLASHRVLLLVLTLALSSCISQSDIQASYVKSQNLCRVEATKAAVTEDTQASLGLAFSKCMIKAGWNVASPKTGVAAATNPPSGSPSTNPIAATTAAPAQPTPTANPASAAPSARPPAANTSTPVPLPAPAAATYQPARPSSATSTSSPTYGSGAGRNF